MSQKLLKYPLAIMVILFCYLLFVHFDKKGIFSRRRQLLEGTPCIAALVKLELKIPKNWAVNCDKNNLIVDIDEVVPPAVKDPKKVKILLYREMANHLSFIAKNSPVANLEFINSILIKIKSEFLQIEALTTGDSLVKLTTLNSPEIIREHLKNTVKVKELPK
ncbi:MAG: hypothetical protein DRQ88_05005 [Epsilonproteobacteria bacterium]|nr:MAG: hypothetical protein DRQ89_10800 [Campylobacterota bacterium]RLA66893.1 MAG: hypothetical protein DRQ88_05005 [Campylobacterota bacterium]